MKNKKKTCRAAGNADFSPHRIPDAIWDGVSHTHDPPTEPHTHVFLLSARSDHHRRVPQIILIINLQTRDLPRTGGARRGPLV